MLPFFRPFTGSPRLHQNPPSYHSETALRGNTNSNLLGRPSADSPSEGPIDQDLQLCEEAFVRPRIYSETREMLTGTHPSPSLSGCGVGHDLHVDFPARRADRSDTRSMPDDARVSVNISGRAVKPAGPQEPCGTDRSVGSNFTLQSPATPAGSATPPVWVATQVSDKFASTIPGGPEVVGVVESTLSQPLGHHPTPLRPYHQGRCIFAGLGNDLQWQDNRGTLECGGSRTTHQWPRAQGGHPRLEVIPGRGHEVITPDTGSLSSTAYPSGDGQYYGGCVCEQEESPQSLSLSLLALELWSFLLTRGLWVTARHLPGVLNVEADTALREFNTRTE